MCMHDNDYIKQGNALQKIPGNGYLMQYMCIFYENSSTAALVLLHAVPYSCFLTKHVSGAMSELKLASLLCLLSTAQQKKNRNRSLRQRYSIYTERIDLN